METAYELLRGSTGFALVVVGISLIVTPKSQPVFRHLGRMFVCVGAVFFVSASDILEALPQDLGDLLILVFIYFLSQSLFEVALFVFGGERRPGWARRVWVIGAFWMAGFWALQFVDYLIRFTGPSVSLEEGRWVGFFHSVGDITVYLWPLVILAVSFTLCRWRLRDFPSRSREARPLLWGLALIFGCLGFIVVSMVLHSMMLYQLGHTLLELSVLVWYFFVVRNPDAFVRLRDAVETRSKKRLEVSESEAQIIATRLRVLVESERIHRDPRMTLPFLAKRIHLPAYQLSRYFNQILRRSFPEWLNTLRIEDVCRELAQRPEARVLDLALEVGYSSKGIFNSQFRRIRGVSPSEFRRSLS